jgi:hypothetical protein
MLYVYEKLFEHGNLPQKEHWILMLRGAARAADVKHFSRFYHRLESKVWREEESDEMVKGGRRGQAKF